MIFDTNQICPSTFPEGRTIGKDLNSDLVIWGDLYEQCFTDTTKACIKYAIIDTAEIQIPMSGKTGIETITSMSDIKEGLLQKDIDYIIYWLLGIRKQRKKDYQKASIYFEKINSTIDEKDEDVLFRLSSCYYYLKDFL